MNYDICVLGGCSLDRMFYQNEDGTYNDTPSIKVPGGKGANQAVAAARAGAKVTIITRVGKDAIGKEIVDNLAYNGINTSNVEIVENLTNDCCDIFINIKDKDNEIKRFNGAIDSFTEDMVDKYADVLLASNIIVCQLKVPKQVTKRLINFCYENNKMLILTPCRPDRLSIDEEENRELIEKISIITANQKECETIFKTDNIESCIEKYPNKLIVTLGDNGLMYHNGKRIVRMPAIPVDVVDTTGAGDTLNGNLAYFLSTGLDFAHSLRRAMYASAVKLQKKGAQDGMPYKEELNDFIYNCRNSRFTYQNELNLILANIRKCYMNRNKIEIFEKEDKTFVTSMDLSIEEFLVSKIKKAFPNDNFLAEEKYSDGILEDRTWIIDPIDGTNHYMKQSNSYATQLAFYDKGMTMFSVIYIPKTDELYYAIKNGGAYLNNNKIILPDASSLKMSIVEFGGSIYKKMPAKINCFNKLFNEETGKPKVLDFLYVNSTSLSFTNLASGKTDALILSTTKPWDVMPGILLSEEIGIKCYNLPFDSSVRLYTKSEEIKQLLVD